MHDPASDGKFDGKMQTSICLVPANLVFIFRIRFDNLSRRELSLLLYSLRPAELFRHKLGMGKSIGLARH